MPEEDDNLLAETDPIPFAVSEAGEEHLDWLRSERRAALQEIWRLAAVIGPMLNARERELLHRTCGGAFMSSRYKAHQLPFVDGLLQRHLIDEDFPGSAPSYRRTMLGSIVDVYLQDHIIDAAAVETD